MKNTKFFEKVQNNSKIIGFNSNESKLNLYLINGSDISFYKEVDTI